MTEELRQLSSTFNHTHSTDILFVMDQNDLFSQSISYIHIWCPVVALFVSLFRSRLFGRFSITKFAEQFFAQMLFWVVGVEDLIIFVMMIWFPISSGNIPIEPLSAYIYELAMVNLSLGILGIASPLSSIGFRTAVALGYSIWVFGDGIGHLRRILAGLEPPPHLQSMLYTDLIIPLVILVTLMIVYQNYKSKS